MLVSEIVVSLLLLVLLFSLCLSGGLAWIEMERSVFGFAWSALLGMLDERDGEALWLAAVEAVGRGIVWEAAACLLEPLCMCCIQYFLSGTTSLLHRHFFPSVLLHLPGSSSMLFRFPKHDLLQPWTENNSKRANQPYFHHSKREHVVNYDLSINFSKAWWGWINKTLLKAINFFFL